MRPHTRRDFLGLAGAAAISGGIACLGSALGYFLLKQLDSPAATAQSRPDRLKHIDRPEITPRSGWNAREPNHAAENEPGFYSLSNPEGWRDYEGDLRAIYRTVVVHHSVLVADTDAATMREIQDKHMDDRQWADIGYHYGVGRTGQVFEGRALITRGTHVESFNTGSVGVVFFGNFEEELPAQEQIEAGQRLINWLALRLELTHLAGHDDFNAFTECPGKYLIPYLTALAQSAGLEWGTGGYETPPEQAGATP